MASGCESLSAEISRIVQSPYPTQLKTLHTITTKCTDLDITNWILSSPCQVTALAAAVLDALDLWPYAWDLVARFAHEVNFRDALLNADPSFLPHVVSKAADGEKHYTQSAIAVLSERLPERFALPATAQTLFVRSFDHAAEHPSIATVKPIFLMLKGACSPLLGVLSSAALTRLEEHIFSILRNSRGPEDQSLSLYCLAVMKMMCDTRLDNPSSSDSINTSALLRSESRTPPTWASDAMREFFTGSKAPKTLQLIAVRMLWACKFDGTGNAADVDECATIAIEVLAGVAPDLRKSWCSSNAMVVQKLEEKVLSADVSGHRKFQVLRFLALLTAEHKSSGAITKIYFDLLLRPRNTDLIARSCTAPHIESLRRVLKSVDAKSWSAYMDSVLELLGSTTPRELLQVLRSLTVFLQFLRGQVEDIPELRRGILSAMGNAAFLQQLKDMSIPVICTDSSELDTMSRPHACRDAIASVRCSSIHELCVLYLTSALVAEPKERCGPTSIRLGYRSLSEVSYQLSHKCVHRAPPQRLKGLLGSKIEVTRTPQEHLSKWKDRLAEDLQSAATAQRVAVLQSVALIVADLEDRCSTVERPLREEQERNRELRKQYDDLNLAYSELEASDVDRTLRLQALVESKHEVTEELGRSREDAKELLQRIAELEMSLSKAKVDAENQLVALRNARRDSELEHASIMAKDAEELEEMAERLEDTERTLGATNVLMEQISTELKIRTAEKSALHTDINALREDIGAKERASIALVDEKQILIEARDSLTTEKEELRKDLDALRDAHAQEATLLQKEFAEQTLIARSDYENRLKEAVDMHDVTLSNHQQELGSLQKELHEAKETYSREIAARDGRMSSLQTMVDRLERKCEQKDRHIAEAQTMRSNLMAAMGIGGLQAASGGIPYRSASSSVRSTTAGQQEDKAAKESAMLSVVPPASFASSTDSPDNRSGPTPKRSKPRKSLRKSDTQIGHTATRSIDQPRTLQRRQPFTEVNVNRSPLRRRHTLFGKAVVDSGRMAKSRAPVQMDADDDMFDGSDLFASTPGMAIPQQENEENEDCTESEVHSIYG